MARGGGTMPSDDEGGAAAAAPAHERKVGLMGMIVMGFFMCAHGQRGAVAGGPAAVRADGARGRAAHPLAAGVAHDRRVRHRGPSIASAVFVQRAFTTIGANTFFTWLNCLVDASIYPLMAAMYTEEVAHVLGCARYFDSQIFCMASSRR